MYRILYHYPYQQIDTGSPKVLLEMVQGLDRSMFQPLFLANGDGPLVDALRNMDVEILFHPARPINIRKPIDGLRRVFSFSKLLKKHFIDIIHVNDFCWNLDMIVGAGVRRLPVIQHIHNAGPVHYRDLARFFTDRVFIVSNAQRKFSTGLRLIEDRLETLYNSIDIEKFSNGRCLREELNIPPNSIVVGTIAQVRETKGIDILLETARKSLQRQKDLYFLQIGPDGNHEKNYADKMRGIAAEPEFNNRFKFLGSRTDIADLLATMDIFLLPSRVEPFGIVVIEAMAAGLPVIASQVGGIKEIISSSKLGWLVGPNEPDAYAAALQQVLELPDRGKTIALAGRRSLMGRFDRKTIAKQLEAAYLDLLEN